MTVEVRRGFRTYDIEMYNTKTERWLRDEARKVSVRNEARTVTKVTRIGTNRAQDGKD